MGGTGKASEQGKGSLHPISATPRLILLSRASPGSTECPSRPFLGLLPGLYRPHPHPPSPPRWRSCWHWTRSERSPSALRRSGLLSPLCHTRHPVSQHPLRAPAVPRPPSPALLAQGGPAYSQPSPSVAPSQVPEPLSLPSATVLPGMWTSFPCSKASHDPPLPQTKSHFLGLVFNNSNY